MTTSRVSRLLRQNRDWAAETEAARPGFFKTLAAQQRPGLLWIGCADSRVPADRITGLEPGEVFVHRNVANLVHPADSNVLTVISFAVDVLKVTDIVVCGHYGCGGVQAVLEGGRLDMLTDWLWPLRTTARVHQQRLQHLDDVARFRRMCELNVIEQVVNVSDTSVVRKAWAEGRELSVHGWVYGLENGLLHDLGISAASHDELQQRYAEVIV
ncbi:MAG TPA: carbonic anhydrase [Euzebya sp.]|nr:carbonic anhydrase [Euzebya sp.]